MNDDVARAVSLLQAGGVVALPTETVYGLGADASNPQAVAKVFALKGRPADHPLIVHIGSIDKLPQWAREIPASAYKLAERYWPGPLTMILKRAPGVTDAVTGGQDTIGVRVPDHPATLQVLEQFGGGVAAPSANRFGKVSPTCAAHVAAEFGDEVDFILDGGWCSVGLESTIVDLTGATPRVLRVGSVTLADIMDVLGGHGSAEEAPGSAEAVKVPGSHLKHYSPETPLCLVPAEEISARVERALGRGSRVGVIARSVPEDARVASAGEWVGMPEDAEGYGRLLYATMRDLDGSGCEVILVEEPPTSMEWEVVIDRLTRAASGGCGDQ